MNQLTDELEIIHQFCGLQDSINLSKVNKESQRTFKLSKKDELKKIKRAMSFFDTRYISIMIKSGELNPSFGNNVLLKAAVKGCDQTFAFGIMKKLPDNFDVRFDNDYLIKSAMSMSHYNTVKELIKLNECYDEDDLNLLKYFYECGSDYMISYLRRHMYKIGVYQCNMRSQDPVVVEHVRLRIPSEPINTYLLGSSRLIRLFEHERLVSPYPYSKDPYKKSLLLLETKHGKFNVALNWINGLENSKQHIGYTNDIRSEFVNSYQKDGFPVLMKKKSNIIATVIIENGSRHYNTELKYLHYLIKKRENDTVEVTIKAINKPLSHDITFVITKIELISN